MIDEDSILIIGDKKTAYVSDRCDRRQVNRIGAGIRPHDDKIGIRIGRKDAVISMEKESQQEKADRGTRCKGGGVGIPRSVGAEFRLMQRICCTDCRKNTDDRCHRSDYRDAMHDLLLTASNRNDGLSIGLE